MNRIKSVTVTKLFGYEGNDYTVDFIVDSPVTFLYAFNGMGKTTLLKLTFAALKQDFRLLKSIGFESLVICFTNKEELKVINKIGKKFDYDELEKEKNFESPFLYELKLRKSKYFGYKILKIDFKTEAERNILDDYTNKIKANILFANKDYSRTNPYFGNDSISIKLNSFWNLIKDNPEIINQLKKFLDEKDKDNDKSLDDKKYKIMEEAKIRAAAADYTVSGANLGMKFGSIGGPLGIAGGILIGTTIGSAVGLIKKYNNDKSLKKKYKSLSEYGKHIESREDEIEIKLPDKIDEIQNELNEVFLVNGNIEAKIKLFEDIINSYNSFTEKNIYINQDTKKLEIKNKSGDILSPKCLSSGEKNIILLYFYLVFSVPECNNADEMSIVFIDEPEVSLHSGWLINFVENINHINSILNRNENYQCIIATHSPSITYYDSELMVKMIKK